MSTSHTISPEDQVVSPELKVRSLPTGSVRATGFLFAIAATVAYAVFDWGDPVLGAVVGVLAFLPCMVVVSTITEGRRRAFDRLFTWLIYAAFALAIAPLLSVGFDVLSRGINRLDADFFYRSMNNISATDIGGGAYHALVGTLQQVGFAMLFAVPLGLLASIYIVEYGRGRLVATVRFFVDIMTGIPSIVAGLFVLAFWVLGLGMGYSGFAAALALTVLMLPTVIRSSEEMLRLVPGALREGSYALGIAKWKTLVKIVLPSALPGIMTGIMLAVARAAGETAPVLLVAGGNPAINMNPFSDRQAALSTFVFEQAGAASRYAPDRAWAAALTLIAIVMTLNIGARLIARRNQRTSR